MCGSPWSRASKKWKQSDASQVLQLHYLAPMMWIKAPRDIKFPCQRTQLSHFRRVPIPDHVAAGYAVIAVAIVAVAVVVVIAILIRIGIGIAIEIAVVAGMMVGGKVAAHRMILTMINAVVIDKECAGEDGEVHAAEDMAVDMVAAGMAAIDRHNAVQEEEAVDIVVAGDEVEEDVVDHEVVGDMVATEILMIVVVDIKFK